MTISYLMGPPGSFELSNVNATAFPDLQQQLITLTCVLEPNYGVKLGDPDSRSLWIILQNTVKSTYDQKLHAAGKKTKQTKTHIYFRTGSGVSMVQSISRICSS